MITNKVKSSKTASRWTRSLYIFIELPKKTLFVLWETQMFFVYLPFRCFTKMVRLITSIISSKFQNKEKKMLKTVMCCDLDDSEKVLNALHNIQTSSLSVVRKINATNLNRKLVARSNDVKKEVSSDTSIRETRKEYISYDSLLKNNFETAESSISRSESEVTLAEKTCDIPSKTSPATLENNAREQLIEFSLRNFLRSYFDELHKQKEYFEIKNSCPDVVSNSNNFNDTDFKTDVTEIRESNASSYILQTLAKLLNSENFELKEQLKMATTQLGDVKTTTSRLDSKVLDLEVQLNQIKYILQAVLENRDTMQKKLTTLEQMIDEEEIYLNESNLKDCNYDHRFFATSQDCSSSGTSTPLEHLEISFEESDE